MMTLNAKTIGIIWALLFSLPAFGQVNEKYQLALTALRKNPVVELSKKEMIHAVSPLLKLLDNEPNKDLALVIFKEHYKILTPIYVDVLMESFTEDELKQLIQLEPADIPPKLQQKLNAAMLKMFQEKAKASDLIALQVIEILDNYERAR